jgi:DNA-binding SARP family transcriptional activator
MPEQAPSVDRLILRLADGVRRTRLIEPILAACPPLVVICAPSGYGKTVLAAQVAVSRGSESTLWIDGIALGSSFARVLVGLLQRVSAFDAEAQDLSIEELADACVGVLGSLPADASMLIVLDAMDECLDLTALGVIDALASQTPPGSTLLLITKAPVVELGLPKGTWLVDAPMLRLDEGETAELWRRHNRASPAPGEARALAGMSGCHAALASLMARRAALLGDVGQLEAGDALTGDLIRGLTSQLDSRERAVLQVAAVAREGSESLLRASLADENVGSVLARVAEVLPLVSCTEPGPGQRFCVSSLVAAALGGARGLLQSDSRVAERLILELAHTGRCVDALAVALDSAVTLLVANTLREVGFKVLAGPRAELARIALDSLSPADVAGDSQLMMLAAESAWSTGDSLRALRTARLAQRLAEGELDDRGALKARLAVAKFRVSVGDYGGIINEVTSLVSLWDAIDDTDDLCALLGSSQVAYALDGNRAGLVACQEIVAQVRSSTGARESAMARLDIADALVAALFEGDFTAASEKCRRAAACRHLNPNQRAGAAVNLASSALAAGLIEECVRAAEGGLSIARGPGVDPGLAGALESAKAFAIGLYAPESDAGSAFEDAIEVAAVAGDQLALTSDLVYCSMGLLAFNERTRASSYSDRAVSAALETGSPVLTWLAELVQAMCSLAVDDVDRARSAANRILPQVEKISAMGHVLHARMILAEVAIRNEDLDQAVQHLSSVSGYIVEKSPALTVACYLRTFPDLLGPLALAMGVETVPIRVLNLLNGEYEARAFDAATAVLTKAEVDRLEERVHGDSTRAAAHERVAKAEPAVCHVRLLGGLQVSTPQRVVADSDWKKRKARLLFAMLVARSGTDVSRGEIIDHLWPEMEEARGLNNFYVVWSAMKRALAPDGKRGAEALFVEHTHGVCRVMPGQVVSDLDLFRGALAKARAAHASAAPADELPALLEALDLYRGDVLPGDVYDDWFGSIRDRFKRDYEDTALRAGRLYAAAGEPLEALSVLRDASVRNPWREDLYQAMLRLQIAGGQRAAAIETYFMCRSRLVEDLGIDPSPETTALYEQALGMEERAA